MSIKNRPDPSRENNHPSSNRRDFIKKASIGGLGMGLLSQSALGESAAAFQNKPAAKAPIKITDLRCAIMGGSPVIRITTSEGISGYGQAETSKSYLKPYVLFYKNI